MRFPRLDTALWLCNRVIAKLPWHCVRRWFYRHVMEFEVGERTAIFMDAWFDCNRGFKIGDHSVINQRCRLDNRGGLSIGSNVSISAEVIILTADHDPQSDTFEGRQLPVVIGDYVFVGTRAMILPGVTIGRGAVVGAGAVVTSDVSAMAIVAGVPARVIGQRRSLLRYELNYERLLH